MGFSLSVESHRDGDLLLRGVQFDQRNTPRLADGEYTSIEIGIAHVVNLRQPTRIGKAPLKFQAEGAAHFNKALQQYIPTPHIQGPDIPGGVRPAFYWEIPR